MLVLRAFRDAGGVSAGSPRLQTGGLQVCFLQTSSAQSCGLRRGASQPSSGGAVVKAAVRVSSGVPPFLFPFGLSARRRAERFGRWGHPESLLEQADWGGVAGAGVRAGGAKTGSRSRSLGGAAAGRPGFRGGGLFPRRQRQFRSGRAKKQATKRRTKKDFPSPKRRRFVKTGFSARYKEARRSGRPRGRKSPPGQRRPPLSAFALRREEVRAARSAFALRREEVRAGRSAFALRRGEVRAARSAFALRRGEVRAARSAFALRRAKLPAAWSAFGRPPRGPAISGSPWLETAAPFRVKVRQIRGPGYHKIN